MTRNFYIIVFVLVALLVANLIYSYSINKKVEKIVIVDVIKVLNDFSMKKELEARVEVKLNDYTNSLDSIKALIEGYQKLSKYELSKPLEYKFQELQAEAQNAYDVSNQNINEQVWKRLNPLIDEWGQANNFRLLIGANGMGTVLYNDKAVDKTKELITYINAKYEKGN